MGAEKAEKLDLYQATGVKTGAVIVQNSFGDFFPVDGNLPRDEQNHLIALKGMDELAEASEILMNVVQIPVFPGTKQADIDELIWGLKGRGYEPQLILMVMGGDPMNPADEDVVKKDLWEGVQTAIRNLLPGVSSTSLEKWMSWQDEKTSTDYDDAIVQLAQLHARVYTEQNMELSAIESWNIEFLRPGEMMTFTNLQKAWEVVQAMNEAIGGKKFFKVLVDSAHCGDSWEGIDATTELLEKMIKAGDVNMVHGSVATTRWHHASDEGMRAAVISTAVRNWVKLVVDEVFNPKDGALENLIKAKLGFGVNTGLGMSQTEILAANVKDTARRVLILKEREVIPEKVAA